MYFLYIVRCADHTLYTGITTDVARRLTEHNSSARGARYTRARRPVRLVYTRRYRTRSTATRAEVAMKNMTHLEKTQLITTSQHSWK